MDELLDAVVAAGKCVARKPWASPHLERQAVDQRAYVPHHDTSMRILNSFQVLVVR